MLYELEEYLYQLPQELIAQEPSTQRDHSRLMVIWRSGASLEHRHFYELPHLLMPGDVLVINNTRVVPARLIGKKPTGGRVEVLVLDVAGDTKGRRCLLKSRKGLRKGDEIIFERGSARLLEHLQDGSSVLEFTLEVPFDEFLERTGKVPLPPYIRKNPLDAREEFHKERYQTVYSQVKGAIAAPTAGLHFSEGLLEALKENGVKVIPITLHVGYGTFRPVRSQDIRDHRLDPEHYYIPQSTAEEINRAKRENRRIFAVGTTVVRALESGASGTAGVFPGGGETTLMILPGYNFRIVDGLITNFHLPGTSLLFLVAAMTGLELMRKAYGVAIKERYRFFSYGDAMLIV